MTTVEQAREALDSATAGANRAAADVEALTSRIRDCDPDGAELLAELVHRRALAQGKVEALTSRIATAAQALRDAERQAQEKQRRRDAEELAQLDADARSISAELDAIAREAQARIADRARVLVAKVTRANELSGRPGWHRNLSWSITGAGSELAHASARLAFLAGGAGRCCPTCGALSPVDTGGAFACAICSWTS